MFGLSVGKLSKVIKSRLSGLPMWSEGFGASGPFLTALYTGEGEIEQG